MSRRVVRSAIVGTALVTIASLGLSGCGGGKADTVATNSASPSATASTGSASPTPTQTKTKASSQAFAVAFLKNLFDGYEKRDVSKAMAQADLQICQACKQSKAYVKQLIAKKYTETIDGPIKITNVQSLPIKTGGIYDVLVTFDEPAGRKIADGGKVLGKIDAGRGSKFEAYMTWSGSAWQMRDMTLRQTDTP